MSKKRKLIIIATIIITLILALIGVSKAITYRNFYVSSLETRENSEGKGETIFCLARGKSLGGTFAQSCVINIGGYPDNVIKPESGKTISNEVAGEIKGTTAYKFTESYPNTRTSVTDKGNAKLAYICYKARGENVYHTYSYAQNAMWKYFKTWMAYCGQKLEVPNMFKYNSSPAVSSYANSVISEAEDYYKALEGKYGIEVVNSDAKIKEITEVIENTDNIENEESTPITRITKYYVGPFKVNITSKKFISSISEEPIVGIDTKNVKGYLGIAKKVNGEIYDNLDTSTAKDGFYIVLDATEEGVNPNQEFKLKYKVLKVKAAIKLYYYSGGASSQQQIAVVNTSKGIQNVTIEFGIKDINKDKDVSIQKYIIETGKFNEDTYTFDNDSTKLGNDRENRYTDTNAKQVEEGIYKGVIAISDNNINGKSSPYKVKAPVRINPEDYVVYKITAYNNGPEKQQIEIRDRIEKPGKLIRDFSKL